MEQLGSVVLECGRRQMTRVVCDVGQPHRMETCGVEEPYEGNLHVRFCGGIGRVIADPTRTGEGCQQTSPPWVCHGVAVDMCYWLPDIFGEISYARQCLLCLYRLDQPPAPGETGGRWA